VFIVYYSRWIEAVKVDSQTPEAVIKACWKVFSHFGIPRELRTDNGGYYDSKEFWKFAETNGMRLVISSPRYPQSNDMAKHAVKVVKESGARLMTGTAPSLLTGRLR